MKKLISLLLVLTMVLSLMGGLTAFASGEVDAPEETPVETPVEERAEEPVAETPVEETAEEPAEDPAEEPADSTDSSEEPEAVASEEPVEALDVDGATWQVATGFVSGQNYVIGVDNGDGKLTVLQNNGGTEVVAAALDSAANATADMIWVATVGTSGSSLSNNGIYLYYKSGFVNAAEKANWSYTDAGVLYYDAGGTKNYTVISGGVLSFSKTDTDASTIVIYTDGEDLGSGSTGSGSGSGSSSSTTAVEYLEANTIGENTYLAFAVNGFTFGVDRGSVSIAAATVDGNSISVSSSNYIEYESADGGYKLYVEDPPGSKSYLYIEDGVLKNSPKDTAAEDLPTGVWTYADKHLSYTDGTGTYYISGADASSVTGGAVPALVTLYTGADKPSKGGGGGSASDPSPDADGPVIEEQPAVVPYVKIWSDDWTKAPTYSIKASLPEGATATAMTFVWYVDGVAVQTEENVAPDAATGIAASTLVATTLASNTTVGVHTVYCDVSCMKLEETTDSVTGETTSADVAHTNTSNEINYIIAEGVLENSALTFSDLHTSFTNVGVAINDIITTHGGMIPALIICTGDWANGNYMGGEAGSDNYNTTMETFIARLIAQAGGIDIVFVSGNHENGAAAADASIAANLGAAKDYDGTGVIYDSSYDSKDVGSSAANKGLVVYGINYENLSMDDGTSSYANVLPDLRAFLTALQKDYHGELVVISGHAGLHELGTSGSNADAWGGGNSYNVDKSDEMVSLLNEFGKTMDIVFFFGHDHSKGESEMYLVPGDSITSTISYAELTTSTQPINFTYAHAGYITNTIGGQQQYTLLTWNNNTFTRTMAVAGGDVLDTLTFTVNRVTPAPNPGSNPDDGNGSGNKTHTAPKTGDDSNIVLWAAVMVICAGSAVALVPSKKHN